MALFSRTQIPKYQNPIRITRPYIKPNYLADTINSAIQGYGSIQNTNMQRQLFNAKLKAAADAKLAQDAEQATLRGMFTNMAPTQQQEFFYEGPQMGSAHPQMAANPMVTQPGMNMPTAISAAMQQNPNMDIGSLMKYAGAINQIHNPQIGSTWQDLVRQRRAASWADQDAAKAQAIVDAFAAQTSGNLKAGINEFGQGNVLDYQTSAAGVNPATYESDPAKIIASLLPRNNLPAGYVDDEGKLVDDSMTYRLDPTKYEKAGGQLGWKMFVADHLSPLVEHLQRTTKLTDLEIQNEIGRVIQLGRAPQGQPGGTFNYRGVVSEIMRIMKGNTQSNNLSTQAAEARF